MHEVEISPISPERYRSVLSPGPLEAFERAIEEARRLLEGRVVWNVGSTARGGGVAELLESLLAYARGAGVDARWVVIEAGPDFFTVTKRIHNRLHGAAGDGGALDQEAQRIYERALAENAAALEGRVRRGEVVIWRCHVGLDRPNQLAREAWAFLHRYVVEAHVYVFSRQSFAWEGLDRD